MFPEGWDSTMSEDAAAGNDRRPGDSEAEVAALLRFFDLAPMFAVLTDETGTIRRLNAHGAHRLGLEAGSATGRKLTELVPPEDMESIQRLLSTPADSDGRETFVQARIITADRHDQTFDWRRIPNSGTPSDQGAFLVVATDADAECLKARQAKESLEPLIASINGIVWEADARTFAFTFVSEMAETILGYPRKRWFEKGFWADHIVDEDRERVFDFCVAATAQGRNHEFEYRITAADGREVWLHDIVTVISENGSPRTLRGVMVDVTERRQAEKATREANETYRALFEAGNAIKLLIDPENAGIVDANLAACRFYGYPKEVLTTMLITRLDCAPEGAVLDMLRATGEGLGTRHYEFVHRLASGERREVEMFTSPIERTDQNLLYASIHDVTERNSERRRLSRVRSQNESQNHMLEAMLEGESLTGVMSHICHFVHSAAPDTAIAIATIDTSKESLQLQATLGLPAGLASVAADSKLGEGIWREAGSARDTPLARSHNLLADSGCERFRDPAQRSGLHSCTTLPVRSSQGEILGYLALFTPGSWNLGDDHAQELKIATSLIRTAVERELNLRTLQELEARVQAEFSASPLPIQTLTLDGKVALWNPACASDFGWELEDVVGQVTPVLPVETVTSIREAILSGTERGELDITTTRRNGEPISLSVYFAPLMDGSGDVSGMVVVSKDTTEEKRKDRTTRRLAVAIDNAPDSIAITDTGGRIIYHNEAMSVATGYSSEELLGATPAVLKSGVHDRAFYDTLWATITAGRVWKGRFVNRRKDGSLYQEDKTIAPVRDADGRTISYVAIGRDVTESIELEKRLVEAQKMEAVGQLAGGIAHDFNNILQGILSFVDLIRLTLGDRLGEVSADLDEISESASRAAGLTRQLLAFSRQQVVQMRPTDLPTLVGKLMRLVRRVMREDIEVAYESCPQPVSVMADPSQIEQIVLNLCLNARDAMPSGGSLSVSTKLISLAESLEHPQLCARQGEYVRLQIRDTGHGMDSQTQLRAFEPFFTTKGLAGGTGLGLAVVYGIVQQHNGIIDLESTPGLGTTFDVYLPTTRALQPGDDTASGIRARPSVAETILFAEDDAVIRGAVERVLTREGYEVIIASTGEELVAAFESHRATISMVVSDVVMPRLGGIEAVSRIRRIAPETKVLFCSGYSDEMAAIRVDVNQTIDLISKPFVIEVLLARIREILDR
jgi:PAS domain S-box-containing protein